jgi:hypothetical protein
MAIQVLPGGVCRGVRRIKKPQNVQVEIIHQYPGRAPRMELSVIENGDSRGLRISKKVAEVLIASGLSVGG